MRGYIYIIGLLLLFSCSSEDTPSSIKTATLHTEDGYTLKYYADSVNYLGDTPPSVIRTQPVAPDYVGVVYGYAKKEENDVWCRTVFGAWCTEYGLTPDKFYYTRQDTYFQYIPCRSDEIIFAYIPAKGHMGLYPFPKTFYEGFDCNPANVGGRLVADTHLLYVGYDADGKPVGQYFPCSPDNLAWHFSRFTYESD